MKSVVHQRANSDIAKSRGKANGAAIETSIEGVDLPNIEHVATSRMVHHSMRPICLSVYENVVTTTHDLRSRRMKNVVHQRANSDVANSRGKANGTAIETSIEGVTVGLPNIKHLVTSRTAHHSMHPLCLSIVCPFVRFALIVESDIRCDKNIATMTHGLRSRRIKNVVHQRAKSDVAKSRGKVSKANRTATATSIERVDLPNNWIEKVLALRAPDLANIKGGLPSFSSARWNELAPSLGLPDDLSTAKFDSYRIRPVLLPPSFHEATTKAAWRIQDVYQERLAQDREQARIKVFDAAASLICQTILWHQQPTLVVLIMIGGILFFVIELKFSYQGKDNIAQLFLKLLLTNKVFSVVLFAYVESLAASLETSQKRLSLSIDFSPAQELLSNQTNDSIQYEAAFKFAQQSLSKFLEPANSIKNIEEKSSKAIELLTKSVRSIPRVSYYSGKEDPSTKMK
ncbi:hypothetical protein BGY98DRAFT_929750 [Russula aff. rugulosa BPL654]|nr:hypothetical protein BGY98DRAFT_929750 [Russula aff. rugulosa BPL654]